MSSRSEAPMYTTLTTGGNYGSNILHLTFIRTAYRHWICISGVYVTHTHTHTDRILRRLGIPGLHALPLAGTVGCFEVIRSASGQFPSLEVCLPTLPLKKEGQPPITSEPIPLTMQAQKGRFESSSCVNKCARYKRNTYTEKRWVYESLRHE